MYKTTREWWRSIQSWSKEVKICFVQGSPWQCSKRDASSEVPRFCFCSPLDRTPCQSELSLLGKYFERDYWQRSETVRTVLALWQPCETLVWSCLLIPWHWYTSLASMNPGRVHCAGVSGRGCRKEWSQSSWQDLYAQTVADGFMWKKWESRNIAHQNPQCIKLMS